MYDQAVALVREHATEVTEAGVNLIKSKQLRVYTQLEEAELTKRATTVLEQHLSYIESGNVERWQQYCIYTVELRVKQGVEYTTVINFNRCMLKVLGDFFQENIPKLDTVDEQPAMKILRKLEARLVGLDAVATATATTVGMRTKKET